MPAQTKPATPTLRLSSDGTGLLISYLFPDGRYVVSWCPIEGMRHGK